MTAQPFGILEGADICEDCLGQIKINGR